MGGSYGSTGWGGGPRYGGNRDNGAGFGYADGPVRPEDFQATYRDTLRSLNGLEQQIRDDPNMSRDVKDLVQQLRQLDPFAYSNDPLLAERIHAALISGVEQVELELRRKVDETAGGSVRSPGAGSVPQGYADAVAEYFRRLSKSK